MPKKEIRFFILILCIAFIVPQITLATWWNPVSWGMWGKMWSVFHKTEKTPLVDQTVGWKTYTNTKYGFEIKYPSNFSINKKVDNNGGINVGVGPSSSRDEKIPGLLIKVHKNYPGSIGKGNLVDINEVLFTHSGGLYPDGMNVYSEYYEVIRNNMVYSIHIGQDLSFGDPLRKDVIGDMTKIIQSFKFITPAVPNQSSIKSCNIASDCPSGYYCAKPGELDGTKTEGQCLPNGTPSPA